MIAAVEGDWTRLGRLLQERRGQLGFGFRRRKEFAAQAGLSDRTIARIESGQPTPRTPATKARIETAYEWAAGSFDTVLAGGDPAPADSEYVEIPARALRGRAGNLIVVAGDEFEMAIMKSDLRPSDKAEAIMMYREQGQALLEKYGLGKSRKAKRAGTSADHPPA